MRDLHDGFEDGLVALEPLDLRRVSSFADLLEAMSKTAFGARTLGEAFEVTSKAVADADCTKVLTISGAMTVAKMQSTLCDMIDNSFVDIIIATGAIIVHGLSEAVGGQHFRVGHSYTDQELHQRGYNRIYDTIEAEKSLCNLEDFIFDATTSVDWTDPISSFEVNRILGIESLRMNLGRNILGCAAAQGIPVYIPAFTDSGLGLAIVAQRMAPTGFESGILARSRALESLPAFNPFLDLNDYTRRILSAKKLAIFSIGGGVPRNWAQQVAPYVEMIDYYAETSGPLPRFHYGVRICPEPEHWGGLSGCSYSESVSWGKFLSEDDGACFAEVHCDATIVLPLLVKALLEKFRTS